MERPILAQWQTEVLPKHPGYYLVTIQLADGKRFTGYSWYDGAAFMQANRKFKLSNVIAWHLLPVPFEPEQSFGVVGLFADGIVTADFTAQNPVGEGDTDDISW